MNVLDKKIYEKAKNEVYLIYKKPSAFRSGALVKRYKELGGRYEGQKKVIGLTRWFKEEWKDVNPNKKQGSYPVFRPTKKITKQTPLLVSEIKSKNFKEQVKLKQKIKGKRNLPKFLKKI